MVSQTVNIHDKQYQYIKETSDGDGDFSRRVRELLDIAIEYEKKANEMQENTEA